MALKWAYNVTMRTSGRLHQRRTIMHAQTPLAVSSEDSVPFVTSLMRCNTLAKTWGKKNIFEERSIW